MTRYIKTKDGKFAGSIGSGKTYVPTGAPVVAIAPTEPTTSTRDVTTPVDIAQVAPENFPLPEYCTCMRGGDEPFTAGLPGPDLTERETWFQPPAQQSLLAVRDQWLMELTDINDRNRLLTRDDDGHDITENYLSPEGIFTTQPYEDNKAILRGIAAHYRMHAAVLKADGRYRQAHAFAYFAAVCDEASFIQSQNADLINDTEHFEEMHNGARVHLDPHDPDYDSHKSARIAEIRDCIDHCTHELDLDAVSSDSHTITAGAVVIDVAPTVGGDPEAASVAAAMLPDPHQVFLDD